MKNRKGKPICGYDLTPLNPRTMRPRRDVWYRTHCKRVVKDEDKRCWQHKREDDK